MIATQLSTRRRNLTLFAAAFALAAAAFWAIMLTAPPTSLASATAQAGTPVVTICDVLPTGDVTNCSLQN
ncbi:hypothetical protein [Methylobacterium sp. A54F]